MNIKANDSLEALAAFIRDRNPQGFEDLGEFFEGELFQPGADFPGFLRPPANQAGQPRNQLEGQGAGLAPALPQRPLADPFRLPSNDQLVAGAPRPGDEMREAMEWRPEFSNVSIVSSV